MNRVKPVERKKGTLETLLDQVKDKDEEKQTTKDPVKIANETKSIENKKSKDEKQTKLILRQLPISMEASSLQPFWDIGYVWIFFFSIAYLCLWICERLNYRRIEEYHTHFASQDRNWEGIFLLFYLIFAFYWRIKETAHNARMYEMAWGCNMAMLLTALGCFFKKPLFISIGVMMVGLDQLLWYVECVIYLLLGKFPFGVASYMAWPQTSLARKVTTLHHLWFLPIGFYCLRESYFHPFAYELAALLNFLLVMLARIFTPCNVWFPITTSMKDIIKAGKKKNCILNDKETHYMDYLNINLAYEFWSDVHIKFFHLCDNQPYYIYIPFMGIIMNAIQYLPYLLLLTLSHLFLGPPKHV